MKKKLLLHFCCGPCGPNICEELEKEFRISAFWYNPNIYPEDEYKKRMDAFLTFCKYKNLPVIIGSGISINEHLEKTKDWIRQGKDRCELCYKERLDAASAKAKELGIQYFTTTLLSSFYQTAFDIHRWDV